MYYKLNKNCIQFDAFGIHMMGNSSTGDLFGLDENGYDLVMKLIDGCNLDADLLSKSELELLCALIDCGLINNDEEAEGERAAYLHITSHCNMNCAGCYSRFTRNDHAKDVMSTHDILHVIDKLCDAKVSSIVISGGEPFLRKDIIDIIRYLKSDKGVKYVSCISNGKIGIDRYREASELLDCLSFSLDGYSKETSFLRKDSHDKVIEAINQLTPDRDNIKIIFTIHRKNYKYVKEMSDLARSLGVDYSLSIYTTAHSSETADFVISEDIVGDFIKYVQESETYISDTPLEDSLGCRVCCGAGSTLISIAADGEIMPCHMFYDRKFSLGNALTDDITKVFNNSQPMLSVDEKTKCRNCELRYLCGGGCLFRSYLQSGNLKDTDPLCPLFAIGIEQTVRTLIG